MLNPPRPVHQPRQWGGGGGGGHPILVVGYEHTPCTPHIRPGCQETAARRGQSSQPKVDAATGCQGCRPSLVLLLAPQSQTPTLAGHLQLPTLAQPIQGECPWSCVLCFPPKVRTSACSEIKCFLNAGGSGLTPGNSAKPRDILRLVGTLSSAGQGLQLPTGHRERS
jgi:hypothetical protein